MGPTQFIAALGKGKPAAVYFLRGPDRFIQLLEKKAEVVEMQPLDRREAARWLKEYLAHAGVEIKPDLAEEIAARFESAGESGQARRTGVNLLWMRTEVEKLLVARLGSKRLNPEDVELMV